MKAGIVTFPGSNCDDDAYYALTHLAGFQGERHWHKSTPDFSDCDLVILPGGFSYGDYLRCGAMAAVSPIMESVKAFAGKGGLVLGICNGFQILCEAGLLPGALARNSGLTFSCQDVVLKVESNQGPWTNELTAGQTLTIPIAHGDGRYVIPEAEVERMRSRGEILLTYQNNPNGSVGDIAGVCNAQKNVFGLMPHPERA
ncbi:MAG: phosphoribosylformylglycinamidine synthase subunit PurQ, partial [Deltaproteobacteria bacterium]|nr:phosphoribosylformylglycinamidine synthase subunit PurQ [Deltaproteobacteria bacterium]